MRRHCCAALSSLFDQALRILKQSRRDSTKDKPGDVRHVGYSTGLGSCHHAYIAKLSEKPENYENRRRDVRHLDEYKYEQQRPDLIAGKRDQKRAHYCGDRAAGAERRDLRGRGDSNLREHRGDSTQQVFWQKSISLEAFGRY